MHVLQIDPGQFKQPRGVAVDPADDGLVYISDRDNNALRMYKKNGDHYKSLTNLGSPYGVAVDC